MAQFPPNQSNYRQPTDNPAHNQLYNGTAQYNKEKEDVQGQVHGTPFVPLGQPHPGVISYDYNPNVMGQHQQYHHLPQIDYGGYMNMQRRMDDGNQNHTNFPGISSGYSRAVAPQIPGHEQSVCFPIQQQPAPGSSNLIGFQAVKLIRKIWGTPDGVKKSRFIQCRPTCGSKSICKPVSCEVTQYQSPKPRKCAPPFQSFKIESSSQCSTSPQISVQPRIKMAKCQHRLVSQPRCMLVMRTNDPNSSQTQEYPMTMSMVENPAGTQQDWSTITSSQRQECCEETKSPEPSSADIGVGCTDQRYMSASRGRASSRNFIQDSRDFIRNDRRDDFFDDKYRYYGGRGNYGGGRGYYCDDNYGFGCRARSCDNRDRDRCRPSTLCDSCESFERWREKCESKKKQNEAVVKKETKDGQNDPKPIDQATSSDEKLGKKGKSVSVNTSKTKIKKSKSKLKKSKSDGSLKTKKKGKKGKEKEKEKGKGKGKKGKKSGKKKK